MIQIPYFSGKSLTEIESDEAMQQAIESLVELSRESLDHIAWALAELLEKLGKTVRLLSLSFNMDGDT